MAINRIKCWRIDVSNYDLDTIVKEQHDIDLVRKSMLKNGYKAFFLNEKEEIEKTGWYKNQLMGEKSKFYIYGSGVYRLANIDLTEKELYFEKDIFFVGYRPWIFHSWQSDYAFSRNHIHQSLSETINIINSNRKPKRPLELVESTRIEDGAKDIVTAIKQNIDKSLITVFDITNVAKVMNSNNDSQVPTKYQPNSNVVFELSYALQRKNEGQIIIVKQKRDDLESDIVPFDIQQHKYYLYEQTGELQQQLIHIISNTLERIGWIYK